MKTVGSLIVANYVENGKVVGKKSGKNRHSFSNVNVLYFDGRKDVTQVVAKGPNDKHYKYVHLERHYTGVGKPGSYYLIYFSPENGEGRTIAQNLFNSIHGTELENILAVVGTNGTARKIQWML